MQITPCRVGQTPVISEARAGRHTGLAQNAWLNVTPSRIKRSRFGVRIERMPVAGDAVVAMLIGLDEENVGWCDHFELVW